MSASAQTELEHLRKRVFELEAERELTAAALRESEEWQRLAVDASGIGLWSWNIESNTVTWSDRIYELHGVRHGTFGGTVEDFARLVHPADSDKVSTAIATAFKGSPRYQVEFRALLPDGGIRWLSTTGRVSFNSDGNPVRLMGAVSDITGRKIADERLLASEERFRALANSIPSFVWTSDDDGNATYMNDSWYAYTGFNESEALGRGWMMALHPDDLDRCVDSWRRASDEHRQYEAEVRYRAADGQYRWHLARALPVEDPVTARRLWYGTSADVEDYKRTESALRRSKEDLEQFAYAAAHDLQEPLRMISIYAELLSRRYKGKLASDADVYIKHTTDGAKRMQRLVEDLLAYTRIIHADEEPSSAVDCDSVLQDALANLQSQIDQTLAEIVAKPLPKVVGRDTRILQLFQNLIANAIKYRGMEKPQITVSASREGRMCKFSIRDNGIGIRPEYHERIFGVFRRLHGHEISGTGIGLAICKRIVEQAGGRIWVESRGDGTGSTFVFTLPEATAAAM
jgi:PAS domain S-box-containing protein